MGLGVELMPKRRLKNINVFEVSFVDKAANGQKFLVFKRSGGGGDPLEEKETAELEGNKVDDSIRLAGLSKMLNEEVKTKALDSNGSEDKIKEDSDFEDEDTRYISLKKEIDGLRVMIDELRLGLPIRKGLQETEEPRTRMNPKDKTISVIKSREMRSKMTHAHAPNPTQWAKELLQDGE